MFLLLLERAEESETSTGCLPYALQPGIEPATLGVHPDQESNPKPFGIRDDAPTNRAARPGQFDFLNLKSGPRGVLSTAVGTQ